MRPRHLFIYLHPKAYKPRKVDIRTTLGSSSRSEMRADANNRVDRNNHTYKLRERAIRREEREARAWRGKRSREANHGLSYRERPKRGVEPTSGGGREETKVLKRVRPKTTKAPDISLYPEVLTPRTVIIRTTFGSRDRRGSSKSSRGREETKVLRE